MSESDTPRPTSPEDEAARGAIDAVWRIESPRLLGGLVRVVGDLDRAEDLAQFALLRALETWPTEGIPDNPGAWLMATAKHRAFDRQRRARMKDRKHEQLQHARSSAHTPNIETAIDEDVGDDLLRLILIACHPILSTQARVGLTLKLVGGLSTTEIARAFLISESTAAQRLVRAKKTIAAAKVPFEVPHGEALAERIPHVLAVLYLIFNEGHAATSDASVVRARLCAEAMRLARVFAALVPEHAEAHGLSALLELTAARIPARTARDGSIVLLEDQDRTRWDRLLARRGHASLERAIALSAPLGPYTLQAAISWCHTRAKTFEETDWDEILALYDALTALTGSPVVELNRAMAMAMAWGPEEALELLDELADDPALQGYHHLPSVRGEVLFRAGRMPEARQAFERAASLASNERDRAMLLERANACDAFRLEVVSKQDK